MSVQVTEGVLTPFDWGLGYQDWVDVPAPSAGANASFLVDGAWYARVLAARARLTTSAVVANRFLSLDYVDARGTVRASSGASVAVPASQTNVQHDWAWNRGASSSGSGAATASPLLSAFCPPGFTIRFTVSGIDVGDTLTVLSLWLEKFPTGYKGYPSGAGAASSNPLE